MPQPSWHKGERACWCDASNVTFITGKAFHFWPPVIASGPMWDLMLSHAQHLLLFFLETAPCMSWRTDKGPWRTPFLSNVSPFDFEGRSSPPPISWEHSGLLMNLTSWSKTGVVGQPTGKEELSFLRGLLGSECFRPPQIQMLSSKCLMW